MNKDQFEKLMKSAPKPVIHIRAPYEFNENQINEFKKGFEEEGYLVFLESGTNYGESEIVGIYSVWDKMFGVKGIDEFHYMEVPEGTTKSGLEEMIKIRWKTFDQSGDNIESITFGS